MFEPLQICALRPLPCIHLHCGEGAHAADTDINTLKASPLWHALDCIFLSKMKVELFCFLSRRLGDHSCPTSPVVTTVINLLNAGRWQGDGNQPSITLGHSIGELAAAHGGAILTIDETIHAANIVGRVGSQITGAMVHTTLARDAIQAWAESDLCIAAVNGVSDASENRVSATLCGSIESVERWVKNNESGKKLLPPHPWHHPAYLQVSTLREALEQLPGSARTLKKPASYAAQPLFISATNSQPTQQLVAAYWEKWLSCCVDFKGALEAAALHLQSSCYLVETGPHQVLGGFAAESLRACGVCVRSFAASMRRGQSSQFWSMERARLVSTISSTATKEVPPDQHSPNQVLTQIVSLVSECTGVHETDLDQPLFECCLDSYSMPAFVEALNATFNTQLPTIIVFRHGTIRTLAASVSQSDSSALNLSPTGPALQQLPISSCAGRWPGSQAGVDFSAFNMACGDAISSSRWVYDDNISAAAVCGQLAAAQQFDNTFFSISHSESASIDPQHRLLLEVGYDAVHGAGMRFRGVSGSNISVLVGIMNTDFVEFIDSQSVYAATGTQISIASGRISFALGVHGACLTIDTACSSTLVALEIGTSSCRSNASDSAVVCAANLLLSPRLFSLFASAGMLSPDGRCKTFDGRANGYVRAESIGALTLERATARCQPNVSCCMVRADGRSASLTAPNGEAQKLMIAAALASSANTCLYYAEAHGTGTALGDPTEIAALLGMLDARGQSCTTSLKSKVGHSEPAAGFVGLLALLGPFRSRNTCACTDSLALCVAHLRVVNPLISACFCSTVAMLPSQCHIRPYNLPFNVSSFGYSGTIAHVVLRGGAVNNSLSIRVSGDVTVRFRKHSFSWRQPLSVPLLQCASSNDSMSRDGHRYVMFVADLFSVVSNHVIQDRVILPATGYLEMARSAMITAMALSEIYFLKPFAFEMPYDTLECIVHEDRFISSSTSSTPEESLSSTASAVTHCSGSLVHQKNLPDQNLIDLQSLACAHACCASSMYDFFHAAELQYGPTFRTLSQAWKGGQHATSRLHVRHIDAYTDVHVHPAALDDVVCLGLYIDMMGTETQLPFAIENCAIQRQLGKLWAVRMLT